MENKDIRVGKLARRTGLTVRTLHHWDQVGLLSPPKPGPEATGPPPGVGRSVGLDSGPSGGRQGHIGRGVTHNHGEDGNDREALFTGATRSP